MLPDESSRMSEVMDAEGLSEVEEREAAEQAAAGTERGTLGGHTR